MSTKIWRILTLCLGALLLAACAAPEPAYKMEPIDGLEWACSPEDAAEKFGISDATLQEEIYADPRTHTFLQIEDQTDLAVLGVPTDSCVLTFHLCHTSEILYPRVEETPYRLGGIMFTPKDDQEATEAFTALFGEPELTDGKNVVESENKGGRVFLRWRSVETTATEYTPEQQAWLSDMWDRLVEKGIPEELRPKEPSHMLVIEKELQTGRYSVGGALCYQAAAQADIDAGKWPRG